MELSETEIVMWWVISQIQTKLQMNLSSTTIICYRQIGYPIILSMKPMILRKAIKPSKYPSM